MFLPKEGDQMIDIDIDMQTLILVFLASLGGMLFLCIVSRLLRVLALL